LGLSFSTLTEERSSTTVAAVTVVFAEAVARRCYDGVPLRWRRREEERTRSYLLK